MVLEATVICVDNSDWMRNGDYNPTRLEAQHDAVNLLCNAKTQSNPENTVGIVSCGGKRPEVLVTLTSDIGKVLTSLHDAPLGGKLHLSEGVQVAQLVLKHRQNKNQQQRIIFFVGSPIHEDTESLVRLGKRLKKNNISLDLVNFGEEAENTPKLEALLGAVNNSDNSHLVTIPPGPHILSDLLISSPLVAGGGAMGEGAAFSGAGGANPFDAYGGVDPSLDPELALALKLSMDEERARQEARDRSTGAEEGAAPAPAPVSTGSSASSSSTTPAAAPSGTSEVVMTDADNDEEDDLLQQALAMSMPSSSGTSSSAPAATTSTPAAQQPTTTTSSSSATQDVDMDELSEEQEIALAMQMSMAQQAAQQQQSGGEGGVDFNQVMDDPNFVNSVLASLPGVDPNDDRIRSVLQGLGKKEEKKDDDKK